MTVLFEITEDCLETGLRGYPCGYCTTSEVDPNKGLSYVGIPIADLAFKMPEEVIYLLYYGESASKEKLAKFKDDLQKRAHCTQKFLTALKNLPKEGDPMKLLCMALLLLGQLEKSGDYQEDALRLIAKIPEVVANVINHHASWLGRPSKPELGYIENFTQMLGFENKLSDRQHLNDVFRVFNVLHYDHDGGNLSTFVSKAVASGLDDLYGSMCAGMAALSGPRHGRANLDALEFLQNLHKHLADNPKPGEIEKIVLQKLEAKELIFGFGHAILRVEDPRATILYDMAKNFYLNHPLVRIALQLREEGTKALKSQPKISNPYPNVDAISGALLTAAGFPYPQYYTVLFGLARVVGIAIQIIYERCYARGGKGLPIVRPTYIYKERRSL